MADLPLVQLPYPEEETRTFELSTSLSPNWDKNGRIFYTDETGQVVRPQTKYNPLQMLGRRLKAFGSNAKNFVEDFNMDKSHTYFAPFEDINEQYKAGNIDKSELPYLAQGRAEQEIRDAQQQERDNINRGWLGTGLSAASMLPIFNIPYVGTGLGGAMYDLGQGITEGNNADELWDRTKRGFAIGESVGAIPYVGKFAGKTKAGQAVGNALNKAGEKFANTKLYDALMTDIKAFNPNKQTAYHGSPYDFNKFSNEAIGTGEGAQAHGYGHYAALNKDVAQDYADRLASEKPIFYEGKEYSFEDPRWGKNNPNFDFLHEIYNIKNNKRSVYSDVDEAIKGYSELYRKGLERIKDPQEIEYLKSIGADLSPERLAQLEKEKTQALEFISNFDKNKLEKAPNKQLYKLSVPKDDVMLREGATFAQQPKKVQEAIKSIVKENPELAEVIDTRTADEFFEIAQNKLGKKGKNIMKEVFDAELSGDENKIINAWDKYNEFESKNPNITRTNFDPNEIYGYLKNYKDNGVDETGRLFQNQYSNTNLYKYLEDEKNFNKALYDKGIKGISYNGGIDGEARVIFNPDDIVIGRKYYNQPNLYEQLTGKQNTGALVDALFNR